MLRWLLGVAELRAARIACVGLAIALTVNLFYLGAGPGAVGLFVPPWDKVAHFTVFAILSAPCWRSGSACADRGSRWRPFALIGIGDELHQLKLPGRSAGLDDWVVDATAGVCVVAAIAVMRRLAVRESNAGATVR